VLGLVLLLLVPKRNRQDELPMVPEQSEVGRVLVNVQESSIH